MSSGNSIQKHVFSLQSPDQTNEKSVWETEEAIAWLLGTEFI